MKVEFRRAGRVLASGVVYYSGLLCLRRWWRRKVMRKKEICVLRFLPGRIVQGHVWTLREIRGVLRRDRRSLAQLAHTRFTFLW